MVERISRDFQLGGHKAAAIAMVLEKASIDLISEMDDDFVRRIFLEPKPSAQAALDAAFRKYGPPPPSSPCPTAAQHCRICRTQAPITAGHNKLKKQPISNETGCFFQTICKFRPRRSGPCDTTSGARA